MTPEQIAALTAISATVSKVGTWPIGSIIAAVVFGPWIVLWLVSRSMEKRHEAALKMYENNVKLVKNYEKVASEQADTIRLSTAATTELVTYLKNRTPCHEIMAKRPG
ncbi:MAG: hypothetical protein A4E66_00029 [Syntrophus sp. PtaB.Bin001]|nr:MAG: hypothetical protein A4E66_00029 [Syntrophus sp. PtaB.Bin001]